MKCLFIAMAIFCNGNWSALSSQSPDAIRLIYPRENLTLSTYDSTITLGRVLIPNAKLEINGQSVRLNSDGTFIGFIGIDPDLVDDQLNFKMTCRIISGDSTSTFIRNVKIPLPMKPLPEDSLVIDTNYLFPQYSASLQKGDHLVLSVRGTPQAQAFASLIDSSGKMIVDSIPMTETETGLMDDFGNAFFGKGKASRRQPVPGIYTTTFIFREGMNFSNARLRFTLLKDDSRVNAWAKASLSVFKNYKIVELTGDINNATVAPNRAYYYFLPKGVRAAVTGRMADQVKLQLSSEHSAWLPLANVKFLAEGTPLPQSTIPVVRVKNESNHTQFKVFMSEKLPFVVRQVSANELQLRIFGGISDTDWIRFENSAGDITHAYWSQPENGVYQLNVVLKNPHYWGYQTFYDGTNLIWNIRHKPKSSKLSGLRICVDAGHSTDIGATGPRGLTEQYVNLLVAQKLKNELEKEGAIVIMTRTDTVKQVGLYDRVAIANENHCDLFVSIHHNAQPDGVNPFDPNFGPSVIYYHPQSKLLAETIQQSMIKETQLPDFGVFQGNIAVCRNSEMPAVLVECAFLTLPEQELLASNEKFQKKVVAAIKNGIKNFLKITQ
ncbi:N-acetylmuramoyl-L-alanine amidase [bacterium]|nr:N-acetylmuramoyl-L-alanine amidase [bacterium]